MADSPLIQSLMTAVDASPTDVPLRVHLAGLLLDAGRLNDAIAQCATALQHDPGSEEARAVMARAVAGPAPQAPAAAAPAAPVASPASAAPAVPAAPPAPAPESASAAPAAPPAPAPESAPVAPSAPVPAAPPAPSPTPPAPAAPPAPPAPAAPPAPPTPPASTGGEPDPDPGPDHGDRVLVGAGGPPTPSPTYDWTSGEEEMRDVVPPRFVSSSDDEGAGPDAGDGRGAGTPETVRADADGPVSEDAWEIERTDTLRLDDVGGMQEVKDRLESAFLAPLRNPELQRLYGKSLRGGLLLYGPPGCGKTFIARAVAGELGAGFLSVTISDILDMYIGNSERNITEVFETARRNAPCVLFFDELDALGAKRVANRSNALRGTVNQLLTELDGVQGGANEGVFVLGATNTPWDVDPALRRPGRLDRMLLVLPPDRPAREAILRYHLRDRPVSGIDLGKLARRTEGLSGADLAHLCEAASEQALMDSARSGEVRMIEMRDLLNAAQGMRPSTEPWFATARNVAMFNNEGGTYDDLLTYLKRTKKL